MAEPHGNVTEFHDDMTWSELLGPAMKIAQDGDEKAATEFLEGYVAYLQRRNDWSPQKARECALSNIGYYAGYYGHETMEAVGKVFEAAHPIFGRTLPESPDQALEAGKRWALGEFKP